MSAADYRLMTEATGVRIAEALEDVTAMVGPKGDTGEVSEAELTAKLADKADVIVDTASGAIASFPDGAAVPAKDITIGIEPVQSGSGDPSPTNVRPISGWTGTNVTRTGFNVWDEEWELGALYWSTGLPYSSDIRIRSAYFTCLPSTTYCWSCNSGPINMTMFEYDSEQNMLSRVASGINRVSTFTTSDKAAYLRFYLQEDYGATYHHDICINLSAPEKNGIYEPGHVVTIPISWQSEAGTVYGGTLDVTTGLLTVTHGNIASYSGETLQGRWISSMDVYSAGGTPTTGAQVVYELATPQTYQLSPAEVTLLLGDNNVWADAGDSTVTYRADTKLYIQNINAPTDDDMIADAQIASGKYFIIGGNLYKSTTTIPAGDMITPGTNCILTNLADALNALNT